MVFLASSTLCSDKSPVTYGAEESNWKVVEASLSSLEQEEMMVNSPKIINSFFIIVFI